MAEVTVTSDGFVVPDIETIRAVLQKLREDMDTDPSLKITFISNPGLVLGQRGLSQKVQLQLLQESEISDDTSAEWCAVTGCLHTNGCVIFTS